MPGKIVCKYYWGKINIIVTTIKKRKLIWSIISVLIPLVIINIVC